MHEIKRIRDEIRENAKTLNASFYMTLVSIIQSFAIGFLLTTVADELFKRNAEVAIILLQGLAVFQAIVLTWHVNIQNATVYKQVFSILDSYIPFAFGIPEYALIYCIHPDKTEWWFYAFGLFTALTVFAYMEMYRGNIKEPDCVKIDKFLGFYHWGIIGYITAGSILFFVFAYLVKAYPGLQIPFIVTVNVSFFGFTVIHERCFWRRIVKAETSTAHS